MATGFRCPECGAPHRLFDALTDSVLAMTRELRLVDVLQRMVDSSRHLIGARFAAVGVRGAGSSFEAWVTADGEDAAAAPPMTGVLASVIADGQPWSTPDMRADPRFDGWPEELPAICSLLAVPITSDGATMGAFYFGNEDRWGFTPEHLRIMELMAPHAAVAIANARLHERSRELTVVQERNRLARELHDSVTQALFSMRLAAGTAAATLDAEPEKAREQIELLRRLAGGALAEMRALIAELRPPDVESHGLVETLRSHVDLLRRVHAAEVTLESTLAARLDARREAELFRLAQEALANALKHSGGAGIAVYLEDGENGMVRMRISDDGCGFDVAASHNGGRFGLVSMRERAEALGGRLTIDSRASQGTEVTVEVPA